MTKESVKKLYSIIVHKCGFCLRAAFTIFSSKTAAFIKGGFYWRKHITDMFHKTKVPTPAQRHR